MGNTKDLYISAYIAFGSYFLLLLLFLIYISAKDVQKIDSVSKNTVLELEVIVLKDKKSEKKSIVKQIHIKDTKIAKSVVKKSSSVSAKQRSDLKSLFANVKTKATIVKKKKVSNVKKSSISSRFKSKFEKQVKREKVAISKLTDTKNQKIKKITSSEAKYANDKYFSSIHKILYSRYNQLLRIDNLSAAAIITINSRGEFDYIIIEYSDDGAFNSQLELFLEKQKILDFPPPPKSKVNIEIEFNTKEKN